MKFKGVIELSEGFELAFTIRKKAEPRTATIEDLWLSDAPFSFQTFTAELQRYAVIDEGRKWIKHQTRGGHSTQAFYVVGCYECLLYYGCLHEMSWPQVMKAFNTTFKTSINNSKVLENKSKCHQETSYFIRIFTQHSRECQANAKT